MRFLRPMAFVFLSLAILAAWSGDAGAQKPLRKVIIATAAPIINSGVAYLSSVPRFMKYYEEEGLDVEVQPMAALAAVQMTATGKADLAHGGPTGVLIAREKGAKLKAVYVDVRRNMFFPVVLENSPVASVKDFKGKLMGVVSYGSQANEIFKAMFEEAGLDPDRDVTLVEVGVGAQAVSALTSNRVQVWGSWDTQIAIAETMGLRFRRFSSQYASNLSFSTGLFAREDFIRQHPEVILGVLRGVAKGSLFTVANPEAAVRIHWQLYPNSKPQGQDDATAFRSDLHPLRARMQSVAIDPGTKWGMMSRESVETYQSFLLKFKRLTKPTDPDAFYTNEFIDKTNAFSESAIRRQALEFK